MSVLVRGKVVWGKLFLQHMCSPDLDCGLELTVACCGMSMLWYGKASA